MEGPLGQTADPIILKPLKRSELKGCIIFLAKPIEAQDTAGGGFLCLFLRDCKKVISLFAE